MKKTMALLGAAAVVLTLDLVLNRSNYGHFVFPLWNYFKQNVFLGTPSSYGTTPFYFSFEILWHFMTEPSFMIAFVFLPLAYRWSPVLALAAFTLFLCHLIVPHKEFRFFYGPAVLLSGVGTAALQRWIEDKPRRLFPAGFAFFIAFAAVAFWRAQTKVAWAEYEVPSRLETWAGVQGDIRGLITYGWGGIRSGGAFTFHRTLPYEFAENLQQLRIRKLDPALFNYLITSSSEAAPCRDRIMDLYGGSLYHCSEKELRILLDLPFESKAAPE